ncbi:ABC transporter permease [Engelhardtia mirabilis]|uniref:ABC transporter permease YtrF n=1 Tax=Engelhardtia mirabilis TaxID=2528011 RepID=A0A518BR29_9BACT|nr:ABC transporter permease YtrF precursor [Planctomycetes bacterium Pla133]QDV03726.1 ABC transporter permease YtrF precursor [Planctomycetes bacterium Pla86]
MPWLLLFRNLFAHPVRSLLTLGSIVVAVFLICFLRAMVGALEAGVEASSQRRLIVQSAVSLFVNLPTSYQTKIEAVPGVDSSMKMQWFGGYYQDPSNFFAQFGVDAERLLRAYPEIEIVEGSALDFEARRSSCIIGEQLAADFGWSVGDSIPMVGALYPRADGSTWNFEVAGIYRALSNNVDDRTMWFHFEYLERSLETGGALGPGGVGVFVLHLAPGADATGVMARVDALFENGPQRVQTTTESEFQRQFVTMLGSVPTLLSSIGGGVLFAIALATFNTMLMASRERTHSIGILKALGFTHRTAFALLMGESLLLCGLGGAIGVAVALAIDGPVRGFLMSYGFTAFEVAPSTAALGLGLALSVGLLAGLAPAIGAARLRVVEALRFEG